MKYVRNILKRIGRTIVKQNLITNNDKILLALSGGKDSLVLLEALADSRKNLPLHVELLATHIQIEKIGYAADIKFLESMCSNLAVPLHILQIDFEMEEHSKKGICFLCSWHRRKALFQLAKKHQCNKIAFGHHMDDAIETLFMNMIYHGSVSSMPYTLNMFNGRMQLIRPLLEMTDAELEKFAAAQNYPCELKACPHGNSKRKEIASVIGLIASHHKAARKNIFRSLSNFYPDYLPNYRK
jgi:tRNA 2-thiocytidine biosynthesis protein TtcA